MTFPIYKSHQPYLFEFENEKYLIFCNLEDGDRHSRIDQNGKYTEYTPWRIKLINLTRNIEYKTIAPVKALIECSPYVTIVDGKLNISYVAGWIYSTYQGLKYSLFVGSCKINHDAKTFELVNCVETIQETFSGISNSEIFIEGARNGNSEIMVTNVATGVTQNIEIDCDYIYTIIGYHADLRSFIITSYTDKSQPQSHLINFDTKECNRILTGDGRNVYKCTILGDEMIHAEKNSNTFEDRKLILTDYKLVSENSLIKYL